MLTERELQVINGVIEGKSSEEIAKTIFVSKSKVEKIKGDLIYSLECNNMYQVIGICFRNGWVK